MVMSTGAIARTRPEKPPMVKRQMKPIAKSIGVSKLMEPRHIVEIQLKILTPVGTAMRIVAYMKKRLPEAGMPTVNMWWPHTMNDRIAMDAVAYTMEA